MGQKSIQPTPQPTNFNISQWVNQNYSTSEPGLLEYGKMRTLKNRNTDQLIDKYQQTFLSHTDYQSYLKSFHWRQNQNYIVRAYHLVTKNSSKYCSSTYQVDIYIQHPKNRLSDFSDIPFPDTLYCLKAILTGYCKLYTTVGPFPIREQQVCIDQRGHVRVWLNRDLSRNYAEEWEIMPRVRNQAEEEEDMVGEIVAMVGRNADGELEPRPGFREFWEKGRDGQVLGFDQTLMLVQEYAEINHAKIPEYFTSVLEVYENQDDLYQLGEQDPSLGNNREEIGLYTRNNDNSIQGSQVQRLTNKTRRSQYEKLSKMGSQQLRLSAVSNKNKGQTYRLSGLSGLEDQGRSRKQSGLGGIDFVNVGTNQGNFSQLATVNGQASRWLSFQPQQPYIPSSQAYLQQSRQGQINRISSQSQHRMSNQRIQSNPNPFLKIPRNTHNRSITQHPEQHNQSVNSNSSHRQLPTLSNQQPLLPHPAPHPLPISLPQSPQNSSPQLSNNQSLTAQFIHPTSLTSSPYHSNYPSNANSQVQVLAGGGPGFTIVYRPGVQGGGTREAREGRDRLSENGIQKREMTRPFQDIAGEGARTVYCTVEEEVALDPKIARDLLLYT